MKFMCPPQRGRTFPVLGVTTALAFAAGILLTLPAYAARDPLPGNVTGADISGPGSEMTGENAERAKQKVALSLEYAKLGVTSARTAAANPPASKALKLTHYGQKEGYYAARPPG